MALTYFILLPTDATWMVQYPIILLTEDFNRFWENKEKSGNRPIQVNCPFCIIHLQLHIFVAESAGLLQVN